MSVDQAQTEHPGGHPSGVAPDLVEPILAWRGWLVVDTPAGVRLHSTARAQVWGPGVPVTATCRPPSRLLPWPRRAPHPAPAEGCTCGVHAAGDLPGALQILDPYARLGWRVRHRILGTVALWGRVVECADGWRAEHGYPAELIISARRLHGVPVPDLEDITTALVSYGVPVRVVDSGTRDEICAALSTPPASAPAGMDAAVRKAAP